MNNQYRLTLFPPTDSSEFISIPILESPFRILNRDQLAITIPYRYSRLARELSTSETLAPYVKNFVFENR